MTPAERAQKAGIERIVIPLPLPHLNHVNLFFHRPSGTLIDSGPGFGAISRIRKVVEGSLRQILLTHEHPDHIGGLLELTQLFSPPILSSPQAAAIIAAVPYRLPEPLKRLLPELTARGEDMFEAIAQLPFAPELREGAIIQLPPHTFRVLHLPGHTPGHIGLYEEREGILFSGDNVLGEGTPYIGDLAIFSITHTQASAEVLEGDLSLYLESLEKLSSLPIELIAPGHGPFCKKDRIAETRDRKLARIEETFSLLKREGPLSPLQVAARLYHQGVAQATLLQGVARAYLKTLEKEKRACHASQDPELYAPL